MRVYYESNGRGANVAKVVVIYLIVLMYQRIYSLVKVDWYDVGEVLSAQLH
jgi:hypothetical protein